MNSALSSPGKDRRLLLCRHAEAGWPENTASDFDRPLTRRGMEEARDMGACLNKHGIRPDLILASAALRTRTTAEILAKAMGCRPDCLRSPR